MCGGLLAGLGFLLGRNLGHQRRSWIVVLIAGIGGALLATVVNASLLTVWILRIYSLQIDTWIYHPLCNGWAFTPQIRLIWISLRCPGGGYVLEMWLHTHLLYKGSAGCAFAIEPETRIIVQQASTLLFWINLPSSFLGSAIIVIIGRLINTTIQPKLPKS